MTLLLINITIYVDVSINPGPQSRNNIEVLFRSRAETKARDRPRHFSNLVQVHLIAPSIVYNNRVRLKADLHCTTGLRHNLFIFANLRSMLLLLAKPG